MTTHNKVNEITNITESVGLDWATPAHDANGNMTTMPQPKDLTKGYTATWDAWNRLVKLTNDADSDKTVAEFEYDGLNRRTIKKPYTGGTLDETRHFYYSNQWQVLEERVDSATTADQQFVWGMRYVDDLVLRDKGSERLYSLQDALFNVVALTDDTGAVKERFAYQPYGASEELNPDFTTYTGTEYNWETRFTGRRLDLDTGLQLNRNRYYHLELGRWISRDPIGYAGGDLNRYGYVSSRPVYSLDSSGQYINGDITTADGDSGYEVPVPQAKARSDKFYICWRPVRGDGAVENIARICDWSHTDIYSKNCGLVRVGFGGKVAEDDPREVPLNKKGWECVELKRKNFLIRFRDCEIPTLIILTILYGDERRDRLVQWGSGAGRNCKDATDAEIVDCLRKKTKPKGAPGPKSNCQTDCEGAAYGCCLSGFKGASIVPSTQGPWTPVE